MSILAENDPCLGDIKDLDSAKREIEILRNRERAAWDNLEVMAVQVVAPLKDGLDAMRECLERRIKRPNNEEWYSLDAKIHEVERVLELIEALAAPIDYTPDSAYEDGGWNIPNPYEIPKEFEDKMEQLNET